MLGLVRHREADSKTHEVSVPYFVGLGILNLDVEGNQRRGILISEFTSIARSSSVAYSAIRSDVSADGLLG